MRTTEPAYFAAYRSRKMARDVQAYCSRVPYHWSSVDLYGARSYGLRRGLLPGWRRIRADKIVILKGTGRESIKGSTGIREAMVFLYLSEKEKFT